MLEQVYYFIIVMQWRFLLEKVLSGLFVSGAYMRRLIIQNPRFDPKRSKNFILTVTEIFHNDTLSMEINKVVALPLRRAKGFGREIN